MATSFDTIINQAMVEIRDYKLDALYCQDPDAFEEVMTGYMLRELPKFTACLKPLTYNLESLTFDSDFDIYEIAIIADYTVLAFMLDNLQDTLEFKEALQNKEFKRQATGQNLKPRMEYIRAMRGRIKQDEQNYQYQNMSQLPWFGGDDTND